MSRLNSTSQRAQRAAVGRLLALLWGVKKADPRLMSLGQLVKTSRLLAKAGGREAVLSHVADTHFMGDIMNGSDNSRVVVNTTYITSGEFVAKGENFLTREAALVYVGNFVDELERTVTNAQAEAQSKAAAREERRQARIDEMLGKDLLTKKQASLPSALQLTMEMLSVGDTADEVEAEEFVDSIASAVANEVFDHLVDQSREDEEIYLTHSVDKVRDSIALYMRSDNIFIPHRRVDKWGRTQWVRHTMADEAACRLSQVEWERVVCSKWGLETVASGDLGIRFTGDVGGIIEAAQFRMAMRKSAPMRASMGIWMVAGVFA